MVFLHFLSLFHFMYYRIADWNNVYGDGTFAFNVVYPYVTTINTISQSVAMYCLVLFYRATKVSYNELVVVAFETVAIDSAFHFLI